MRLSEFQDEFGLTKTGVENWMERETLRTEYAPTVARSYREFSRLNVIELATIGAATAAGARPGTAVAFAEIVVDAYRRGKVLNWLILPAGSFAAAIETDVIDPANLAEMAGRSPHRSAVVIGAKAIVDQVDALFSGRA